MKKYPILITIGLTIFMCILISIMCIFVSQINTRHLKNTLIETNTLMEIKNDCLFIINKQRKIISKREKTIQLLNTKLERKQVVTISFYHPSSGGINSDSDHTNTATMVTPTVGRTIAISDELFEIGWLGNKIYIDGFGVFLAEDRMGKTTKGKCIDICVSSRKRAFQLGKKYNVLAVRL